MNRHRILIVEDERGILHEIEEALIEEGYDVTTAADGVAGLALAAAKKPHLVVLDIRLPGPSGFEVCQRIRQENLDARVLFLTALKEEADKIRGLELGGDDYMSKPFSMGELKARIKALLRRSGSSGGDPFLRFGEVDIDPVRREVTRDGRPVELTAMEFDLLFYLVKHEREALSRERLLDDVWGHERYPSHRTVDVHILHLRRKLEPDPSRPRHFLTLRGVGYKFTACA